MPDSTRLSDAYFTAKPVPGFSTTCRELPWKGRLPLRTK
ncbi:hypothetical protein PR003_g27543 [Phytophthora rubi]|uniref:Uncharacterized protein n=1 Tax=Phytophthora rubi TaxID=129364 RepID=A0A6A4BXK1_9STRA|nr:hypothetical protein PR003_g27543 [Phytophthora rubi]